MSRVSLGLLVLGGLLFAVGVLLLAMAWQSKFWPVVEGRIEKNYVVSDVVRVGHSVTQGRVYNIEMLYAYVVDGITYRAKRYSIGSGNTAEGPFTKRAEAQAWLKQSPFQVNQAIKVYVDPKNPENTVIRTGIVWSTWVPIILSLLFIVTALLYQRQQNILAANKVTIG